MAQRIMRIEPDMMMCEKFDSMEIQSCSIQQESMAFKKSSAKRSMASNIFGSRKKKMAMERSMSDEDLEEECNAPPPPGLGDALDDDMNERMMEQRKRFKQGYQKLKATKEYVERTYYNMKNPADSQNLVSLNAYWVDLAKYIVKNGGIQGFLSENIIYANNCHAEMIMAISFQDLTFENGQFDIEGVEGRQIQITAHKNKNIIIFLKDIVPCEKKISSNITVNQTFFDPNDRYTYLEDDPSVKIEKEIDQFLVDRVYGCQTIVTNCSVASLEFQILTEIPTGSIPVQQVEYTKSHTDSTIYTQLMHQETKQSQPYVVYKDNCYQYQRNIKILLNQISKTIQFDFYQIYVSPITGIISPQTEEKTKHLETFKDILKNGSHTDILKFIESKNILNDHIFKFNDIFWLLQQDKEFYIKFVQILKKRSIFDLDVWTLSLYHNLPDIFSELFNSQEFQQIYLNQQQTKIINLEYGNLRYDSLQIFEYHPLISQRAHNFMDEKKSKILNNQFKNTYENFLVYMVNTEKVQQNHKIIWTYYLLLQERVQEAFKVFQSIDLRQNSSIEFKIQYDYIDAYLDVYMGFPNFVKARKICEQYLEYPVESWKNLFVNIHNQFREYDGDLKEDIEYVKDNEIGKNLKSSSTEPSFTYKLNGTQLELSYQNLQQIDINMYEIDLEVLFSRSPFQNTVKDEFAFVKPNYHESIKFKSFSIDGVENHNYTIPEKYSKKNLYIQLKTSNQTKYLNYFSNSLKYQLLESYGQVKVMDQKNNALSKVYVKVFSKNHDQSEQFYRDGYTDLRGRFDYALSSANDINVVQKFSLLICSEDFGSIIVEAQKPSNIGQMKGPLLLKKKN